jgi:hypothetical protein
MERNNSKHKEEHEESNNKGEEEQHCTKRTNNVKHTKNTRIREKTTMWDLSWSPNPFLLCF